MSLGTNWVKESFNVSQTIHTPPHLKISRDVGTRGALGAHAPKSFQFQKKDFPLQLFKGLFHAAFLGYVISWLALVCHHLMGLENGDKQAKANQEMTPARNAG